jgi:hypothetical protein
MAAALLSSMLKKTLCAVPQNNTSLTIPPNSYPPNHTPSKVLSTKKVGVIEYKNEMNLTE